MRSLKLPNPALPAKLYEIFDRSGMVIDEVNSNTAGEALAHARLHIGGHAVSAILKKPVDSFVGSDVKPA